jgi:hypothetical protein
LFSIGVPVGITGVHTNVGPGGANTSMGVSSADLGITILGIPVPFL